MNTEKRIELIKSEIRKNNPEFDEKQVEREREQKIYKMVWQLFHLCDKNVPSNVFNKIRDEFEEVIRQYGYDLYEVYYGMVKKDWIEEVNMNIQRSRTKKGKAELLNELLRTHNGRKKADECGMGKEFEKVIKNIRDRYKKDKSISFDENSILGFNGLTYQSPATLGEMRAQVKRIEESMRKSKEDVQKMTMDEKRNYICYIVRLSDGRNIAREGGIENLLDEHLDYIKMRLPKIYRFEWVFLRIQEFASRKDVTNEEKELHEEYLSYGGIEETFEQYIQQRNADKKP